MNKKLYRIKKNQLLGGVCTGLADFFGMDVVIMRIIMICLVFLHSAGLILYILIWIMVPYGPAVEAPDSPTGTADENDAFPVQPQTIPEVKEPARRSFLGGLLLIGLGTSFLLDEWLDFLDSEFFWPALLIVIGIALIINSRLSAKKETEDKE